MISFRALGIFAGCFLFTVSAWSQTQKEMNDEQTQRFEKDDAELNKVYQQLMSMLDDPAKEKLKVSQRAWIAFRDADAIFLADEARGGTLEPLLISSAKADLTEERIKELHKIDDPNRAAGQ